MCNVGGSKYVTELFKYGNRLTCLDVQLANQGLSLSVLSATIVEPEIEVPNSNPLISVFPDTADLEASLNPIVMELGWLESLDYSQSSTSKLDKYWEWADFTKPNFEWRKWGKKQLLYRLENSKIQLVITKIIGIRQLVLSKLYSAPLEGLFGDRETLAALVKHI